MASDAGSNNRPKTPTLSVCFLGSSGSGRTSLKWQYLEKRFSNEATDVGLDYHVELVEIDGVDYRVDLYDPATGQRQLFWRFADLCIPGRDIILLVVDVTKENAFVVVQRNLDLIATRAREPKPITMLIANQIDQETRVITPEQVEACAKTHGIMYAETSALTGEGVEEAFSRCLRAAIERRELYQKAQQGIIRLDQNYAPIQDNSCSS